MQTPNHFPQTNVVLLQLNMKVHARHAHLLYFPAYYLEYMHGERYTTIEGKEIVPEVFEALIGGTQRGRVAAELHLSSIKAQVGGFRERDRGMWAVIKMLCCNHIRMSACM